MSEKVPDRSALSFDQPLMRTGLVIMSFARINIHLRQIFQAHDLRILMGGHGRGYPSIDLRNQIQAALTLRGLEEMEHPDSTFAQS
jgi:hypothetical protein